MIKKVKEMIKLIELDGWVLYAQKGRVTIPDHGKSEVLEHDIVKSILKQAGLA
jgi:predicted RNA binding protein YcfA (HicA-like mRNA interferase family)